MYVQASIWDWFRIVCISYEHLYIQALMPSAHGLIFFRKQLRKKSEWRSDFFIGLSQRTRTDFFYRRQKSDLPYALLSECQLAHKVRFFIGIIELDNDKWQARPYCWITALRFFIGRKGPILIRPKVSVYEPIFTPIFFIYDKKIGSRALGISRRTQQDHTFYQNLT